jgi:two-component system, NarL family, nitrate/nitrite response regulator NarL
MAYPLVRCPNNAAEKENRVNVLVCDDHPIVASAIAMMIETSFGATVCICHTYARAAQIAAEQNDIGLCLLDIHIPGDDARSGVKALQALLPSARFVLFSGSSDEADLMMALDLGMHGFLPKSSSPQVVEAALRLVLAGGIYLPAGIGDLAMRNAGRMDERASGLGHEDTTAAPPPPVEGGYGTLSERQIMVLERVSMGRSNKEIARELAISPATVKAHVAQIIAVLGVSNRIEAAARARSLGLIDHQ